jgi:tetratricopeptide (TPR) repeat protein
MRSAFVSHSSSDDRYVAEMESFLRAAGFDEVFNDVSAIQADEKFWPEIEKGIAKCEAFVVVITSASNASEWVKREVEYARGLSKKVIPVWIEDCPIPPMFADRDVIDFRPGTRQERRFEISRIDKYAPAELIGREDETKLLNDAWEKVLRLEKGRPHLLTFVALGGEGKTSLVAKWAAELAHHDWPGCDAAFAWSFYSQGTRDQVAASSDLFLKEALTFFGGGADKEFAASPAGAFEKGQRLARLVGQRRSLLILDGLEPLQYAPTSPTPGQLKDQGIAALLKGLAADSRGLCVVTTRFSVPDLKAFWQTTAPEVKLLRLSRDAGVHLLKTLGVRGTAQEFATLVEDVKGHALTLTLLGGFLKRAFHGDIRQRDRVKFEKADEQMDGGQAFRTLAAYEQWLVRDGGDEGRREVAVLRLMGLFDRPADAGCLAALRSEPIPGLTKPLAGLADDDWEYCLSGLEAAKLLTVNRDATGALVSLDAHPHLREYFAKQLREQTPDAWRAAHRRLYEHLCATTQEGDQPTLEDLQPLYQAVAHGCQAQLHKETLDEVYYGRIKRGDEYYSSHRLGVFGSDLGAISCFFDQPWRLPSASLRETEQSWLLNDTGFCLRALGRLTEALEPIRVTKETNARRHEWKRAAVSAGNLSELELTLGEVTGAVGDAEESVIYADRSGDAFQRMSKRTTHADALHQAGRRAEAEKRFREAEQMQQEMQPDYPLLYSVASFRYCDLLLAAPERASWQVENAKYEARNAELLEVCRAVAQRATQALTIAEQHLGLLDIALGHLTLGRAALYEAVLSGSSVITCHSSLESAVAGLRRAGQQYYLPLGLITRARSHFLLGARHGPESAQADLDEAWEIAERGPMRLFLADIHLYRARLFGTQNEADRYPWESPEADLVVAEKLIATCGYYRREEEVANALHHDVPSQQRPALSPDTETTPDEQRLIIINQNLQVAKSADSPGEVMKLSLDRARLFTRIRAYEQARWDYKSVLRLCQQLDLKQQWAEAEIELSHVETQSGLFVDALEHLKHAIALLASIGRSDWALQFDPQVRELERLCQQAGHLKNI